MLSTWSCPKCTLNNTLHSEICAVCGYKDSSVVNKILKKFIPNDTPLPKDTVPPFLQNDTPPLPKDAPLTKDTPLPFLPKDTPLIPKETTPFVTPHQNELLSESADMVGTLYVLPSHVEADDKEKKQLNAIIETLRATHSTNFIDDSFRPVDSSIYGDSDKGNRDGRLIWLRPCQINTTRKWTVFSGGSISSSDISQGSLGNCWFLAALAVIAEQRPELILKLVLTKTISPYGIYQVRFCRNGIWKSVIVDDYFPCYADSRTMAFSRSTKGELWVSLMEKAYAKVNGFYKALVAGTMTESMNDLTGAPCEEIYLNISKMEKIWQRLESFLSARFLLGASSTHELPQDVFNEVGLVGNHMYSLLGAKTLRSHRIIQLRNPWGSSHWNGDWSYNSSMWASDHEQSLHYEERGDRAAFWISYEDLLKYFSYISVCKVHTDFTELRYKDKFVFTGQFANSCSQVYRLSVFSPTWLYIGIIQKHVRKPHLQKKQLGGRGWGGGGGPSERLIVSCIIRNKKDGTSRLLKTSNSYYYHEEEMLNAGEYEIYPFAPGNLIEQGFVLALHHNKPIIVERVASSFPQFLSSLHQAVCSHPKTSCTPINSSSNFYQYMSSYCIILLVRNFELDHACTLDVNVKSDFSQGQLVSSRGSLVVHDVVPPWSSKICMVLTSHSGYHISTDYQFKWVSPYTTVMQNSTGIVDDINRSLLM